MPIIQVKLSRALLESLCSPHIIDVHNGSKSRVRGIIERRGRLFAVTGAMYHLTQCVVFVDSLVKGADTALTRAEQEALRERDPEFAQLLAEKGSYYRVRVNFRGQAYMFDGERDEEWRPMLP